MTEDDVWTLYAYLDFITIAVIAAVFVGARLLKFLRSTS